MSDNMQTRDGNGEQWMNGEGVRYDECDNIRKEEQEMRDSLGEYVTNHSRLDIKQHTKIDNDMECDGYLCTAERFNCDKLEDDVFIGVYTNHKRAWVMLEQYKFVRRWELYDEVRVEYDDEDTIADAVQTLLDRQ